MRHLILMFCLILCSCILKASPEHVLDTAILNKAKRAIEIGKYEKAIEVLKPLTDIEAEVLRIEAYHLKGDSDYAIKLGEDLMLDKDYKSARLYELLADASIGLRDWKKAKDYISSALEKSPYSKDLRIKAARIAKKNNDKNGAINHYSKIAVAYMKEKELDKAVSIYREILNMDSENINALEGIARIYELKGEYKNSLKTWWSLSEYFFRQGKNQDWNKALYFTKKIEAISQYPENQKAIIRIAEIHTGLENYPEAENYYNKLDTASLEKVFGLNRLLFKKGSRENYVEVKRSVKKFLKENKKNEDLDKDLKCRNEMLLGMTFFQLKKTRKGLKRMKKVMNNCSAIRKEVEENPKLKKYYSLGETNRKTLRQFFKG